MLSIRHYEDQDLEQATKGYMETFAQEPWNEQWPKELAQTRLSELLSGPQGRGYVCFLDGKLAGVMCGRLITFLHGREYFIDEFFVLSGMQGKGIGTAMIEHAKQELKAEGFVNIVLNTEKGYPAERFYLKNGFCLMESLTFMYLDI